MYTMKGCDVMNVMERKYETTTCGVKFGLYFRAHNSKFPYCVTRNGNIICEADNIKDANHEYNLVQRKLWQKNFRISGTY